MMPSSTFQPSADHRLSPPWLSICSKSSTVKMIVSAMSAHSRTVAADWARGVVSSVRKTREAKMQVRTNESNEMMGARCQRQLTIRRAKYCSPPRVESCLVAISGLMRTSRLEGAGSLTFSIAPSSAVLDRATRLRSFFSVARRSRS